MHLPDIQLGDEKDRQEEPSQIELHFDGRDKVDLFAHRTVVEWRRDQADAVTALHCVSVEGDENLPPSIDSVKSLAEHLAPFACRSR